ncbi:MAG: hypothetical protein WDN46_14865 [Methylocella sp.]
MARKPTSTQAAAASQPVVEIIPSVAQGISAVASASAPFLYFERAPFLGHMDGVVKVALEVSRHVAVSPAGNEVLMDRVIVAHLIGSMEAMKSLRSALDKIIP